MDRLLKYLELEVVGDFLKVKGWGGAAERTCQSLKQWKLKMKYGG